MTQRLDPSLAVLLQYISNNSSGQRDLANRVLNDSNPSFVSTPTIANANYNKPSVLGRIVDILSRPNYAIANTFHEAAQQHNPFAAFFRGLEGRDKTTFSTFLEDDLGVTNPVAKGLGGAALDIALDPTSYIGTGAAKTFIGKLGEKTGLIKAATELPTKPVKAINDINSVTNLSEAFKLKNKIPTNLTDLFDKSYLGKQAALPREIELVKQAAENSPKTIPNVKPDIVLNNYEKGLVDLNLSNIKKSRSKISKKDPNSINPGQQISLWDKLFDEAKQLHPKDMGKAFNKAYQMLQHAENSLEASGRNLLYWDGSKLKLTDVMAELMSGKGVKFVRETMPHIKADLLKTGNIRLYNADVTQSIHNVRVRNAIEESPKIDEAVNSVLREKQSLNELPASDAHLNQLFKSLPALAQKHSVDINSSVAATSMVRKEVKKAIKLDTTLPQQSIKQNAILLNSVLEKGKTTNLTKANSSLTNALIKELDVNRADFKVPLNGKGKPYDTFMGRLFSWYGQKDLRPITEQHLLTATNSSWLRNASIKRIAKNFTREQQLQAIRYAQRLDPNNSQLGTAFKTSLENLFKGSGLTDNSWHGQTVIQRSGIIMDRLNHHLSYVKSPFRFIKQTVKNPITGEMQDFSSGTDWLNSWHSWDIKEPLQFFDEIQGAVEQASHEKALFDEIGERFGSTVAGNGYNTKINHDYLNGYYFTDDIARQIPKVIHDIDTFFTSGVNSPFLKTFDKISRAWKFTVTLPNPSHHIHNLLGDAYMSWMAGVKGVKPYQYAAQIMRTQKDRYKDLNDLENLVAAGAVDRAVGKSIDVKDVLFSNKSGHKFTAEQIYVAANNMGILPQAHIVEDILGGNQPLTGLQPFGGHVRAKLEHFSESREHFARLAHFSDAVKRSKGSDYSEIFRKAGYEVRKWHPDYLTLTPFEKKYLRRVMPFYSWTRRAVPLIIESAIVNPGKTLAYPKIMQGIQTSQGIDFPSRENPFPNNQLFPQWIRDKGIGPIFKEPAWGARSITGLDGKSIGSTIINPSNPMFDLFGQFSNPVSGFGSMLSPALKIPIELLSGKQLFNHAPINKGNFSEYIGNQLPYFPLAQGVFGITPTLGDTGRAKKEGNINIERLVNWLTSLGLRGTGPYIKQAEIEKRAGG